MQRVSSSLFACAAALLAVLALPPSPAGASLLRPPAPRPVPVRTPVGSVTVPVLMYHYVRVNPVASDTLGFSLSVTPSDFAAQMSWLHAEGFHTVSPADVRRALDGVPLPPRPVVLTFDDGYEDFFSAALPVLQREGFTATSFVVSGFLGRGGYMTAAQVQQAAADGMTIAAHTVDHADLTTLTSAAVGFEVAASRTALRQLTGEPVADFAYPYGALDATAVDAVRAAGFADAFTTAPGALLQSGSRLTWPRVRVSGGESLAAFAQGLGARDGSPVALLPSADGGGYTILAGDGAMYRRGSAPQLGSLAPAQPVAPLVGAAPSAAGGWWAGAADGGVFTTGSAPFLGSMGGTRLNAPVVGIAATPSGGGYWLVAADGGIFCFGDATFLGSTGGARLNAPVVAMAATPSGRGYWLFAADGGVFAFGDAPFLGSMGSTRLNARVVGASAQGDGYRLVAADGGIFSFGAPFHGSTGGAHLNAAIVAMADTPSGQGYWLLGADGGVFTFGDAPFLGTTGAHP